MLSPGLLGHSPYFIGSFVCESSCPFSFHYLKPNLKGFHKVVFLAFLVVPFLQKAINKVGPKWLVRSFGFRCC